ncbi:RNA polymerase sigma factor [Candidatus Gottesmanbacteria bacterium]|nr:RNA polymerase sigma factor [Candidatus Gottesmanbacteria bacterium]
MLNEKELVAQILNGNEIALRQFFRYFQPRLLSYIKNKVSSPHDAEEILQDTLLATLEGLRDFSFRCSLFTFICSIANHKVIDFYRRRKVRNIIFSKFSEVEPLLATLFGPEEVLDNELLRQKIKETFARIAPKYGRILKLKYIYGYSVEEVAAKLSISFKSTESMLFRARKAFAAAYLL